MSIGITKIFAKGRGATIVVAASDSSVKSKRNADYVCAGANDEVVIQEAIDALPETGGKIQFLEGHFVKGNAEGITVPSNVDLEATAGTYFKLVDGLDVDACFYKNADKVNGNSGISIIGGNYDCNFRNQLAETYQYLADFENVSGKIDAYITNFTMLEVKRKNSNVPIHNRKFDVSPVLLAPCNSLDEFAVSGLTANGTAEIVTDDGVVGDRCVKVSATDADNATLDIILPDYVEENKEAYEVHMWVKIDVPENVHSLFLGAGRGSGSDGLMCALETNLYPLVVTKIFTPNKWTAITLPLDRYVIAGKPTFRLRLRVKSELSATMWIDHIVLKPAPAEPALSFQFDDALGDSHTSPTMPAAPIMSKYGHRASVGQMGSGHVGGNYLTKEQIDKLVKVYGWEVSTHGMTHIEEDVLLETAWAEITANKTFIQSNGWRGSGFLLYPGHDTRGEVNDAFERIFSGYRNPIQVSPIVRYGRPNLARQISPTSLIVDEKEKAFLRRHGWLNHYTHGVGGTQISAEKLHEWCQFWYDWGLITKLPSEVVDNYWDVPMTTNISY